MVGIKSTSSIAPVKQNGPNVNLSMIKSKQAHVSLCFLAKTCIYSVKRKNVIISSMNGKCLSLIASKKATTS